MGGVIRYRDNIEAYYNLHVVPLSNNDDNYKCMYQLTFDFLRDLEILLSMNADEQISIDNKQIRMSDFANEIFNETYKIYPTNEEMATALEKGLIIDRELPSLNDDYLKAVAEGVFRELGGTIKYQEGIIARYHLIPIPRSSDPKYELLFNTLENLKFLFFLGANEQINIEGVENQSLSISQFRDKILGQLHRIYFGSGIEYAIEKEHNLDIAYAHIRRAYSCLKELLLG